MAGTMVMKQAFVDFQEGGILKLSKYTELEDSEQGYFNNRPGGRDVYKLVDGG
jgi:hypothetical protein